MRKKFLTIEKEGKVRIKNKHNRQQLEDTHPLSSALLRHAQMNMITQGSHSTWKTWKNEENLEISWNFEKFNKYHGKMT